jgi:hypothetical protein
VNADIVGAELDTGGYSTGSDSVTTADAATTTTTGADNATSSSSSAADGMGAGGGASSAQSQSTNSTAVAAESSDSIQGQGGTLSSGGCDPVCPTIQVTAANNSSSITAANVVVTIDWTGYMHIATQHMWFPFPNTSRYFPQFRSVPAIQKLLTATLNQTIGFPLNDPTSYFFTANLGYDTGTDQSGAVTQLNTVIVQMTGPGAAIVRTMYPGELSY